MNVFSLKKKGLRLIAIFLMVGLYQSAAADTLGIYAGAGIWQNTPEGTMTHNGTKNDMEKEHGYDEDNGNFTYIAFEHPFPLIPNARINTLNLETTATHTLTAANAFTFAGTNYTAGTSVTSKLKWEEVDSLLYYEFLDNIISVDAGLGIKNVKAEFSVAANGVTNTLKIEEDVPFVYTMVGAHIPGTGFSFMVEQISSFGSDMEIAQNTTKVAYEIGYMLGIEGGYKTSKANLDGLVGVTGEIEFTGPFVNLLFHF